MCQIQTPMFESSGTRKFRRVLLKLSGEALREPGSTDNISPPIVEDIAAQIKAAHQTGLEIALVVGGGNFWRGVSASNKGMDRATADYMGMLATVMNAMALADAFRAAGVNARVQSALRIDQVVEPYIRGKAIRYLEEGRVVVFGAGTGNPYFTTDTTASLRAIEVEADVVLKGTKVDGVYTADPMKDPTATRYTTISFRDVYEKKLNVMDLTAFTLCQENNLPIIVFNMNQPGSLLRVVQGDESTGTLIK